MQSDALLKATVGTRVPRAAQQMRLAATGQGGLYSTIHSETPIFSVHKKGKILFK